MSLDTAPGFDEIIDRRGTHCVKWDMMEPMFGVSADRGIAMWVADMDFRPPACVTEALRGMLEHGVFGYFGDDRAYRAAICWWMANRHGWQVDPDAILTTHGLVHGTALCVDAFTAPGDGVVLFSPVYHAFARVIKAAGRQVLECPLLTDADGRYRMDLDAAAAALTGRERMLILCSPHNPGGRVWTGDELRAVADFCKARDLILVSDEIHHDLLFAGSRHTVMACAAPGIADRLVMLTATTKTFNIAGAHIGNVIISDPDLRARFAARMAAHGISPNAFGMVMATAAYSADGAIWVDALMRYLQGNRDLFDAAVADIPGVRAMPLQATYLGWVDFRGTGMNRSEIMHRIEREAQIAAYDGAMFGTGGDGFLRINLAAPRAMIAEAATRLQHAFADLQ